MGSCASASCQIGCGCKQAALVSSTGKDLRKVGCSTCTSRCKASGKVFEKLEEPVVFGMEVLLLLHLAAKNGNTELLAQSVAKPGVKLEVTDSSGSTPLHYATRYGQKEAAAILIQAGASLEARDNGGSMPLHCAASRGHLDTLSLLLDARSDISAVDNLGNSALHLVAAKSCDCSDQVGQLLLDKGAEINLQNIYGETPLACADDLGSRSFTDLLRKCGGTR